MFGNEDKANESQGQEQAEVPATVAAIAEANEMTRTSKRLQPGRLEVAESVRNVFDVVVNHGTTLEELLDSAYWAHVAARLQPWDKLEIRWEDGSMYAEAVVASCGRQHASIAITRQIMLDIGAKDMNAVPPGYKVEWAGAISKWRVLRGTDILKDGFETQSRASQWLGNHLIASERAAG